MMKIHKGDTVFILVGKDKGKKGKVERILPKTAQVFVAGVNMVKRHTKRRDEKNPGGIIDRFLPLPISKVALVCPSCHKQTRVRLLVTKTEKVRVCVKCKEKI